MNNEELVELLKFTPDTYKVKIWGWGGFKVIGSVPNETWDYFVHNALSVEDFAIVSDYASDNGIPREHQFCNPGCWEECGQIGSAYGTEFNAGTLVVEDPNGEIVFQAELNQLSDHGAEIRVGYEYEVTDVTDSNTVFVGYSYEKGEFFEAEIYLTAPFDARKLAISFDIIDEVELVNTVFYGDEELDNYDCNTNGKGAEFAFYRMEQNGEEITYKKYIDEGKVEEL